MFDTEEMIDNGTMDAQNTTAAIIKTWSSPDAWQDSVWTLLAATANFAVTQADGTLYTLDGIELDWDGVDCGHATENELCK